MSQVNKQKRSLQSNNTLIRIMGSARHFVTAIIFAFALQFFEQRLLPHGYADGTKASDVPVFSQVDTSIKDLTLKSKHKYD